MNVKTLSKSAVIWLKPVLSCMIKKMLPQQQHTYTDPCALQIRFRKDFLILSFPLLHCFPSLQANQHSENPPNIFAGQGQDKILATTLHHFAYIHSLWCWLWHLMPDGSCMRFSLAFRRSHCMDNHYS